MENRQLKFRAWDAQEKQMISPDYITRTGYAFWKENSIPTSSNVIMQSTGLKDKNNTEIYEGDILKLVSLDPSYPLDDELQEVKYDPYNNGYPAFDLVPGDLQDECNNLQLVIQGDYTCEVVGNIYQKPELL